MSWVAAIGGSVALTGLAVGAIQKGNANKKIKKAMSQRKAYTTPDEVFRIVNAAENKSQGDTITRDYQTNQLDTSFANALGVDQLLGAGPNQVASLFGQKVQGMLQVGEEYHRSNTEYFGNYMKALAVLGENKAAEQQSVDNIWKDYMQSLVARKEDANKTMNSSINGLISSGTSMATSQLYKDNSTGTTTPLVYSTGSVSGGYSGGSATGAPRVSGGTTGGPGGIRIAGGG